MGGEGERVEEGVGGYVERYGSWISDVRLRWGAVE